MLSLDFKQAAPGGALGSSLDIPSSPPTPSSNPFAALVFHKSLGRSAQLQPAPSAPSLDLEPALPGAAPDQDGAQARLSGPSLAAEPSLAAPSTVQPPSSALHKSAASPATSAAPATGTASDCLSAPQTLSPDESTSERPSLQEAPEGTDTGQAAVKARPPPSVFAGTAEHSPVFHGQPKVHDTHLVRVPCICGRPALLANLQLYVDAAAAGSSIGVEARRCSHSRWLCALRHATAEVAMAVASLYSINVCTGLPPQLKCASSWLSFPNNALDIVQDLLHRLEEARATLKRSPRQPQQSHRKKSRQPPQDASRVRRDVLLAADVARPWIGNCITLYESTESA